MMRLYICAAAKDMAAERELMHTYVLPELNDRLAEHDIQVVADDPRSEEDYLALSAADRASEAFDRIDRARPWFIAFVGDAIDDSPIALPADVLARHPWLNEQPGASVLELELAYGALEAPGERKPLIYLRDDRFLREVPLDQRGDFSSEDLDAVGRLEALKTRLRESGVQLVDGYHCRWDGAADRVNDLDELGKQLVEDLYDAIMQAEHPELQIGVLDELPASGAAVGMVNQAGEGPLRSNTSNESNDDELNFDMEDILDVDAGLKESSSASAIEGVEPLDFLEDDATPSAPERALEPTISFNPAYDDDEDVGFDLADEVLEIENAEAVDAAPFVSSHADNAGGAEEVIEDDEVFDDVLALDEIELAGDDDPSATPLALPDEQELGAEELLLDEPVSISDDSPAAESLASPTAEADDEVVDIDLDGMLDDAEPLTDLSDMVDDESSPAGNEELVASPWASELPAASEEEILEAFAALPHEDLPSETPVAENLESADSVDEWLAGPVAEPVDEFGQVPSEAAEPSMAERVAGVDATIAWSTPPGAEVEAEEVLSFDDAGDAQFDDMGVELADAEHEADMAEPVAEFDLPFAAVTPPTETADDFDANAIKAGDDDETALTAEPVSAAANEDDDFSTFLEEPSAEDVPGEIAAEEISAEAINEADDAGWNFDDVEEGAPTAGVFGDEHTIRSTSEATEIGDLDDEAMPVAAAEEDDEFRLQEEAAPFVPAAPVVASSYVPSPAKKKKSSLPMILIALAMLLLVGGGAGAYFAGLIPGLGGGNTNVVQNPPATPTDPATGGIVARINENNQKLTDLFNSARSPSGDIDGAKVQEGLTLLSNLSNTDPDVASEEPIQAHKERFTKLKTDFEQQASAKVHAQRAEEFRSALELAGAGAPESLDQSFLAEAKKLAATDEERNLIADLEQQVANHAAEQARLAVEQAGRAKTEALAAIAAASSDAEDYRAAIDAFVAAHPDDAAISGLKAAQEFEPATLDAVNSLNTLAADWSKLDMRKLSAADAQQQINAATAALSRTTDLPGASEIAQRLELLKPIAARTAAPKLIGGAIEAPFILSVKDGKRYYMTGTPAKKDDKLLATYVSDLGDPGATAEAEIVPAEIDRANSGPSMLAATAKTVNDALATAEAAWEPAFIKALMTVQSDAKMDPVVKAQWLMVLATEGSQGSQPLAATLGDLTELADATGVDASFNWADPAAAATAREKCITALAALPSVRSLAPAIAKGYNGLAALSLPSSVAPVGVLIQGEDDAWTVLLAEDAPDAATLVLISTDSADAPLASTSIGTIEAGEVVLDEAADESDWTQGRVVYATSGAAPAGN